MYVKVLHDYKAKKGLIPGRGFSCLIDGRILFDTGEAPTSLTENMKRLMVKAEDLQAVVISHDNWEHTGGLWELLKRRKGLKVYACPSFSITFQKCVEELGGELIFANEPLEIAENIFVTGELSGSLEESVITEQALVVNGDQGSTIITGCAHQGIINVIKQTKTIFKMNDLYLVFGGFQLENLSAEEIKATINDLKNLGVKKAGPTHCTASKVRKIFSSHFHEDFIAVEAGYIIHL